MALVQMKNQYIRQTFNQLVCEIVGHDVKSEEIRKFVSEGKSNIRCHRCQVPLILKYTNDRKKVLVKEIMV